MAAVLSLGLDAVDIPRPTQSLGVVDQVRQATRRRNRTALACGAVLGGVVPVATYAISHYEIADRPSLAILVLGGLLFSALSVFGFASQAFGSQAKALGFVVLLEGVMVFSGILPLALVSLGLLVAINAISTGMRLALDSREYRQPRQQRRYRRPVRCKKVAAAASGPQQWSLPLQAAVQ